MTYTILSSRLFSTREILKVGRTCFVALLVFSGAYSSTAQEAGPHALWRVYFEAGANSTQIKNWPEAETFFSAAISQAEKHQPAEPYLTLAKYSLATIYWEEGRSDDANKIMQPLKFIMDPAEVRPDIRDSADVLMKLGNLFYMEADAETKDADKQKLKGDALEKITNDADQKKRYSRRYFQWAVVIEQRFFLPHSPELEEPIASLALANFAIGDSSEAIPNFMQLLEILDTSTERETTLMSGSVAYSLAAKPGAAGHLADSLKGEGVHETQNTLTVGLVRFYIGLSYESVASDLAKDNPDKASQTFAQGEHYLEQSTDDRTYGKYIRTVLVRVYNKHAQLLRQLKNPAAAEKLEAKVKILQLKEQKPT